MKKFIYSICVLFLFSCESEKDQKVLCKEWEVTSYLADVPTLGLAVDSRKVDSLFHFPSDGKYIFNADHTYEYLNLSEPWLHQKGSWRIEYGIKKELILQHDTIKQAFATRRMDGQNLILKTIHQGVDFTLDMKPHTPRATAEGFILGKWKVRQSKIVNHGSGEDKYVILQPAELFYQFNPDSKILITNSGKSEEGTWEYKKDSIFCKLNSLPDQILKVAVLHATDSLMIAEFEHTTYNYLTKVSEEVKK